jgi:hypothetical protein
LSSRVTRVAALFAEDVAALVFVVAMIATADSAAASRLAELPTLLVNA